LFQFVKTTTCIREKLGKPTAWLNLAVTQAYINFVVYFHLLIPSQNPRDHALSAWVWRNRAFMTSLF